MKTVLDIKKSGFPVVDKIYNVKSLQELFTAIEEALSINPILESINVRLSNEMNVQELKYKHGFDFRSDTDSCKIRFRGYILWVYFKNDEPVFFDAAGSFTETPSHLCGFSHPDYKTLDFDRFEKIRF